jgi:hypothetical protein
MVVATQPAHGNQTVNPSKNALSCIQNPHSANRSIKCIRVNQQIAANPQIATPNQNNYNPTNTKELGFTDEESDTAITLFGCDCTSCINALRTMRGNPLIPV